MDAYFAFGTYHFFNAVNLKICEYKKEPAILFMTNTFRNAELYYERAKASQLFEHVVWIENVESFWTLPFKKASPKNKAWHLFLFLQRIYYRYFPTVKFYEHIPFMQSKFRRVFMGGRLDYLEPFILYQKKHGGVFIVFDAGLSSRCLDYLTMTAKDKILYFFGIHFDAMASFYYSYNPDMIISKTHKPIKKQVNPLNFSEDEKQTIFQAYGLDPESEIAAPYPAIYFTSSATLSDAVAKQIDWALEHISAHFAPNTIAVQLHPALQAYDIALPVYQNDLPFEMDCLLWNMDQIILISTVSAVMFNLKHIYDKEPYLIFLYHLSDIDLNSCLCVSTEEYDELVDELLVQYYRNSEKIMRPKNQEELSAMLHLALTQTGAAVHV